MSKALLLIDIQRDYFPGGAHPLVGPEPAAEAARRLLADYRDRGEPVIHLQHISEGPDATFMRPGTDGVEIHPLVAPAGDEPVIQKQAPNGFVGTSLERELRGHGIDEIVVAGMMSSMCVDATVRAAVDLGFTATVVHDGCAAPDLRFGDETIPGATVHASFMAALDGMYADVVSADEALGD
ncbi:MAG TPA: cysteine hydrolase family protein [Baekduia sp.]|uniref:cysteine hydrolase family protein n=1 Tax=Baekduia sp. TaxID=2600305 RepID=UPI002CD7CDE4|nr:cysteine hydrolase family protein [Baekduia sp.]HMJ37577.1 cysteine hydrolase family protein [Baekduia sp.]